MFTNVNLATVTQHAPLAPIEAQTVEKSAAATVGDIGTWPGTTFYC